MRFGICFFPTVGPAERDAAGYYDDCLALAEQADAAGFASLKMGEHHASAYGGYSPDPVTFLAAAAQRTRRLRLVTGAVIPAFSHPLHLAGRLAMLDNLSHGRLDAGFGRGFLPAEFEAFGVSMDESQARFVEGVEAVRALWTGADVVSTGIHHRYGPVTVLPRTWQQPHPPIWVAATRTTASFEWAGRNGFNLMTVPHVSTRENLQRLLAAYRRSWRDAGHPPGAERVQINYQCVVDDDATIARDTARGPFADYRGALATAVAPWRRRRSPDYAGYERLVGTVAENTFDRALIDGSVLVGTPDEVVAQLEEVRDSFGEVEPSLQVHFGNMATASSARTLELLSARVLPRLAAVPGR